MKIQKVDDYEALSQATDRHP